jgi:16S rRNA (uracil1498-N3)-methyltransferase
MARFYITPDAWNLDRFTLDSAESHHCLDVLRMRLGDRATVFDGLGNEAEVEIASEAKGRVTLKVLHHSKSPELSCQIVLAQAIPKGKTMEWIIEKATELGAASVVPLLTERTVVRLDSKDALDKQSKWQRVAIEAAKQCGRNWLPEVRTPIAPKAFFEAGEPFDLMLIASLQPDARSIKAVLHDFLGDSARSGHSTAGRVLVLVGPEGDFTPNEVFLAQSAGCRPITLGSIVLRAETAAMYCLSVLAHELFAQ